VPYLNCLLLIQVVLPATTLKSTQNGFGIELLKLQIVYGSMHNQLPWHHNKIAYKLQCLIIQ